MTNKDLTSQELLFLEYLFDGETMRQPEEAKQMAGYPKDYSVLKIMKSVQTELVDRCDRAFTLRAPLAMAGMFDLLSEPETPGSKLKLQVIIEILDRAGVVKKEKTEVAQVAPNFTIVLPSKAEIKEN